MPVATDSHTDCRAWTAQRIHDLLMHVLGERIDVALMQRSPAYARAVLSLCRGCGNAELASLSDKFVQLEGPQ